MAEAYEVFKQFEYKNNSNLVLQREGPGPVQNEPTGEPESLAGRIFGRMGERAAFDRPPEEVSRKRDTQVIARLIRTHYHTPPFFGGDNKWLRSKRQVSLACTECL